MKSSRLAHWLARASELRRVPWPQRVALLVALACLLFGFWLRARGFLYETRALWLDECTWAMMLVELPLRDLLIRPPGFMAVSRLVVGLFGPTETALRALPWLAGVASLGLSAALAWRLFSGPGARALFVAIVALHPIAIDFSKEFKPYSLSLALHLALLLVVLRYVESPRRGELTWLLGVAVVGVIGAQDMVFAYPGVFLVAGLTALRRQRRHLLPIALSALVIVGALLAQYFLIWSRLPAQEAGYWADKYNVFHSDRRPYADWLWSRYRDMAAIPGYRRRFWFGEEWLGFELVKLVKLDLAIWVLLHALGVVTLIVRRRLVLGLLLLPPLALMIVFNAAGFWPFGVFRTNQFVIAYIGAIACSALDRRAEDRSIVAAVLPTALLVLFPLFAFEKSLYFGKKAFTYDSNFPAVVEWLARKRLEPGSTGRELVLLDRRSCDPWRYYTEFHPEVSSWQQKLAKKYRVRCVKSERGLLPRVKRSTKSTQQPTWAVVHARRPFQAKIDKKTRRLGPLLEISRVHTGAHSIYGFVLAD